MVTANKLRAATFGRGLWDIDLNTISDLQAPLIATLAPDNAEMSVAIDTDLAITFDEDIVKGTGVIRIKKETNNSLIETIDVTSNSVSVITSSATITISQLEYETNYFIEIEAGAFVDGSGNNFAGISNNSTWSFTTEPTPDTQAPLIVSLTPANAATGIAKNTDLTVTFDEDIVAGTGSVTVKQLSNQLTFEAIDVTSSNVTVSGMKSTIKMNSDFNDETDYFVEIDAGAFLDMSGNEFAGNSGSELWSFMTEIITGITNKDILKDGMLVHYAKDELTINFESKHENVKEIRVFDVQGKEMTSLSNERNNRQKFTMNNAFQNGVYIVIGVTDKYIFKEKFVVFEK